MVMKSWQEQPLVTVCTCMISLLPTLHDCRGNVEDALEKLQAAVDGAVESIQPIEVDPEKQKQINKQ